MSINHLQLVNQKLAFASSIIASLTASSDNTATISKLQQQSLKDAAVFHLATALHFYVRELAEQHRITGLQVIFSIADLVSTLQKLDKYSSEASELLEIEQTNNSWLNQLTRYHTQLFRSPEKVKEKKAFGQGNAINVIELTEAEEIASLDLTVNLLEIWQNEFRALIARQRETTAEY
jgi:hypothetical protein